MPLRKNQPFLLYQRPLSPLGYAIILGLVLRLLFLFYSDHIFHPDELFQSLELTHRLVFGYGIVAWEYLYGLRSVFYPLFLSLPLYLSKSIGAVYMPTSLFFVRLVLVCLSLGLIPFAYRLVWHITRSPKLSALAAFVSAIWYELIYFAPRAFTETLAVYIYAFAYLITLRRPWQYSLMLFLITMALLLRPQYFPLFLLFVYRLPRHRQVFFSSFLGAGIAVLTLILTDYSFYHQLFVSPLNNLLISFNAGISSLFGTQPATFYPKALILTSAGLVLTVPLALTYPRARPYVLAYLAVLLIHSLIPHKEYRFLFGLIAFGLPLLVLGLVRVLSWFLPARPHLAHHLVLALFCLISLLGLTARLPSQERIYLQPPLFKDPLLKMISHLPPLNACGLYVPDRDWVWTGGYTYLHQAVPLYSLDYPPPASVSPHFLLLPRSVPAPDGYSPYPLEKVPPTPSIPVPFIEYAAYSTDQPCLYPPPLSYRRGFPYLTPVLDRFAPIYVPQ